MGQTIHILVQTAWISIRHRLLYKKEPPSASLSYGLDYFYIWSGIKNNISSIPTKSVNTYRSIFLISSSNCILCFVYIGILTGRIWLRCWVWSGYIRWCFLVIHGCFLTNYCTMWCFLIRAIQYGWLPWNPGQEPFMLLFSVVVVVVEGRYKWIYIPTYLCIPWCVLCGQCFQFPWSPKTSNSYQNQNQNLGRKKRQGKARQGDCLSIIGIIPTWCEYIYISTSLWLAALLCFDRVGD